MEAKEEKRAFTPGPWELVQERDYLNIQETKTNLIVAQFCSVSEANARLIAAAPEMYEMLRDLSKVVKNLESIGASLPYYFKDDMSMSDKLRKVLAKVEGGEG